MKRQKLLHIIMKLRILFHWKQTASEDGHAWRGDERIVTLG